MSDLDFTNKTVLVVGGSSGIGNGIAQSFRQRGADVHVWGTRAAASDYSEEEGSDLHFYPNPASDQIFFTGEGFQNENVEVALYNNMGRQVRNKMILVGQDGSLGLSGLPAGIYILKMNTETGLTQTGKVLIAR